MMSTPNHVINVYKIKYSAVLFATHVVS